MMQQKYRINNAKILNTKFMMQKNKNKINNAIIQNKKYTRSVKDIGRLLLDLGEDPTVILPFTLTAGRLLKR